MKKRYISPETETVLLLNECPMLAGTEARADGIIDNDPDGESFEWGGAQDNFTGGDAKYFHGVNLWDD